MCPVRRASFQSALAVLVAFVVVVPLSAQDASRVAQCRQDLAQAADDTARAMALSEVGFHLIYSEPDSARRFLLSALEMAERIHSPRALANARINLAWYETKAGNNERSEELSRSALTAAQEAKDTRLIATVLSVKAALAEQRGDIAAALALHTSVLEQWEVLGEEGPIASELYNIGRLYEQMDEFARARELFQRALGMQTRLGNRNSQGNCLLMIGNTWEGENAPDRALEHYDSAYAVFKELENHRGMGLVEENRGSLLATRDPAQARDHLEKALVHYAFLGDVADRIFILRQLAKVLVASGDLPGAEGTLREGYALLNGTDDVSMRMDYELSWAELAVEQGRSEEALAHYQRYMTLKDSLQSAGSQRELMRLRAEFETEYAEKDNELLRAKDLENTARLRARDLQLYGSLLLAVLALGGVVLVWRNLRQKRKHAAVLESLNAELGDKQARIEEINGLLRMKVLRTQMDPHFIHNCLNAIRALSLKGEHERAEEYLEGFARLLRNVLEHSVRDRIGLDEELAFLNDYVLLEQLRLGDDFTWSITADEALLEEELQVPSLLVQPFVENAIWHGLAPKRGPKRLEVRFTLEDGIVTCRVEDNGVGRTEKPGTPGRTSLGLKLTGERLELLTERMKSQGGFRIEDLKDGEDRAGGTRVVMRLQA